MVFSISIPALVLADESGRFFPAALGAGFVSFFVLFAIAAIAFTIYCHWRLAQKSGYPGVMSLWLLVPIANIVVQLMWVFTEWPIEAEVKRLRAAQPKA